MKVNRTGTDEDFRYWEGRDLVFPSRDDYETVYVTDRGQFVWEGTASEYREWKEEGDDISGMSVQKVSASKNQNYVEDMKVYRQRISERLQEFKDWVLEENGLLKNIVAHRLFDKVYDDNHSYGLRDVYISFEGWAEIFLED